MTDYTKGTGGAGTLLIRDTGSTVEFHIRSSDGATHNNALPYNWSGSYGSGSATVNYPTGSPWVHVKTLAAPGSGTITYGIGNTGTWGFGGPTSFSVAINRANVPPKPTALGFDQVTHQTARYKFTSNGDGGSPLLPSQIAYGLDPNAGTYFVDSNGVTVLGTFPPGSVLYAWGRCRNAIGWSAWTDRNQVQLLAGAKVRLDGVWKDAVPYVRDAGVWKPAVSYVRVDGVWKTPST